ncbi:MAG: hypothetical protein ACLUJG_07525 [Lawsonibacter sp.]
MWRSLLRLPPVAFVWGVVDTYNRLGVARAAAALAYFLILTLFPLLMCVNFFIGLLPLSPEDVFSALDSILPRESLSLILDYLDYVSAIPQSQSTPCCWPACSPSACPPRRGCAPCSRPWTSCIRSAGSTACTAWSSACPFPCCFC